VDERLHSHFLQCDLVLIELFELAIELLGSGCGVRVQKFELYDTARRRLWGNAPSFCPD